MKLCINLEWVKDSGEIIGLRARVDKEDGSELCTIELDEDTTLMSEPCIKDDLMHRMSKELHELARGCLS